MECAYFTRVVGQYPREYGVLHEITVGASGQLVEVHEVLKVSDLTILKRNTTGSHTYRRMYKVKVILHIHIGRVF